MKTSFFIGKKVHLRAMEPEDLDWMYSIENDPELWDVSNFSTLRTPNMTCFPTNNFV